MPSNGKLQWSCFSGGEIIPEYLSVSLRFVSPNIALTSWLRRNLLYGALAYPYNGIAPCTTHQHAEGIAMTTLELKLNLPDQLAKDAVRMGLTSPDSLQTLLREAVRNRRLAGLAEARKRIAAANIPPLTMEEIEAEIAADRTERRAQSTS